MGLITGHVKPMTIKMNASLRNKNKDWLAWYQDNEATYLPVACCFGELAL